MKNHLEKLMTMMMLLFFSRSKPIYNVDCKQYAVCRNGFKLGFCKLGKRVVHTFGSRKIKKSERVTGRVASISSDIEGFHGFLNNLERHAGKCVKDFWQPSSTTSFWDRLIGFRCTILAVRVARKSILKIGFCSNEHFDMMMELLVKTDAIVTRIHDCAVGFVLEEVERLLVSVRELWLSMCVVTGISNIAIATHMFFHFASMVRLFGCLSTTAVDLEESDNKTLKSYVQFHTNRQAGKSGEDFMVQLPVRELRRAVLNIATVEQDQVKHMEAFHLVCCLRVMTKDQMQDFPEYSTNRLHDMFGVDCSADMFDSSWRGRTAKLQIENNFNLCVSNQEKILAYAFQKPDRFQLIACAPDTDDYISNRHSIILDKYGGLRCEDGGCLACSPIEFLSTLEFNRFSFSRDVMYIPLGFRCVDCQDDDESGMECLCLPISIVRSEFPVVNDDETEGTHGGLTFFKVDSNQPVVINVNRIRGVCHYAKAEREWFFQERFRRKPL